MRGDVWMEKLNNHGRVIDQNAIVLKRTVARQQAVERVMFGGRFALLWLVVCEIFCPGSFQAQVEAEQLAIMTGGTK